MYFGCSPEHTVHLTSCNCQRTYAGGWVVPALLLSCIPDTRPASLFRLPTGTSTAPLLTRAQTGVCYYSVNTPVIDLPAGSEWDASPALQGGSEHHFPQGQSLSKINPGLLMCPGAVTVCVLLFLNKHTVSLTSVAL